MQQYKEVCNYSVLLSLRKLTYSHKVVLPGAKLQEAFHCLGCISRLKIGDTFQNILNEATSKEGITTCETCSDNPCHNQGVCQEAMSTDGYTCICPSRYGGPTCSKLKGEACSPCKLHYKKLTFSLTYGIFRFMWPWEMC